MVKRSVSFMLTAIMLFLASVFPVNAQTPDAPAISVGSAEISYRQREVTVPLIIANASGLFSVGGEITVDAPFSLLSFKVGSEKPFNDGAAFTVTEKEAADTSALFSFGWQSEKGAGGSFVCGTLTFSVPADASAGTVYNVAISVDPDKTSASGENKPEFEVRAGTVTVTDSVIYGDANRDGTTSLRDVSLIIRRVAGYNVDIDTFCADVNLDDEINLKDVSLIIRNLAGWQNARLGHRDKSETIVAATCQQGGSVRLTCSVCGDSVVVPTPQLPHSYKNGKCTMCGLKTADYPLLAYCDYLKKNAAYDNNLRGYAFYTNKKYSSYRMFVSNIYDDSTNSLCLFGTAYFDSGLTATLSVDIDKVSAAGKYEFYYECAYNGEFVSSMKGTVGSGAGTAGCSTYKGDSADKERHIKIAGAISAECFSYMKQLLADSGLDVTVEDFNITP